VFFACEGQVIVVNLARETDTFRRVAEAAKGPLLFDSGLVDDRMDFGKSSHILPILTAELDVTPLLTRWLLHLGHS